MNIEKIFTHAFDRDVASSGSEDLSKGKFNSLMLTCSHLSSADTIDVKIRTPEQTYVLANRLQMGTLSFLTDLDFGVNPDFSTVQYINDIEGAKASTDQLTDYAQRYPEYQTLVLDLGQVTLENAELEIEINTVSTSVTNPAEYSVYMVQHREEADYYRQYDATKDFDSTHNNVESVIYNGSKYIYDGAGSFRDLTFQIEGDFRTKIFDAEGAFASTNLFQAIHAVPENRRMLLYRDPLTVKTEVRCKVLGDIDSKDELVFVKQIIPDIVKFATVEQYEKILKRYEKLDSQQQKNVRRLDSNFSDIESMRATLEAVKQSNKADEEQANA